MNAATNVEVADHRHPLRTDGRHKIVQDSVSHRFMERPLFSIRPEVELKALQLHAQLIGGVFDLNCRKVWLPGHWTDASKLRTAE